MILCDVLGVKSLLSLIVVTVFSPSHERHMKSTAYRLLVLVSLSFSS